MSTSVRLARDDDRTFIDVLGAATALETTSSARALTQSDAEQAYARLVRFCRERPGTVTFVAETDGSCAGFLILLTDVPDDILQRPQAFVAYVAVSPQQRGVGVGRALIRAAIAEGQRRGLTHLSLMVSADNPVARRLYESERFEHERILMTRPLGSGASS